MAAVTQSFDRLIRPCSGGEGFPSGRTHKRGALPPREAPTISQDPADPPRIRSRLIPGLEDRTTADAERAEEHARDDHELRPAGALRTASA